MLVQRSSVSRWFGVLCAATFVALLGLGVGCSKDDFIKTTHFYGSYGDSSGKAGTISLEGVSLAASASGLGKCSDEIPLTGELNIGGLPPITLAGFYCPTGGFISFASDDQAYQFSGSVASGQAAGGVFGPGGQGAFVLFLGGTSSNTATYCATALCDTPVDCQASVAFNVAVSGSDALMTVYYNGKVGIGAGTAGGSAVDFHIVQGGLDLTIHGDVVGSTIAGTWSEADTQVGGTWSGSTAQCSAAPQIRR